MWDDGLGDHVEHPFDYEEEIGIEVAEDLSAKAQIVSVRATAGRKRVTGRNTKVRRKSHRLTILTGSPKDYY